MTQLKIQIQISPQHDCVSMFETCLINAFFFNFLLMTPSEAFSFKCTDIYSVVFIFECSVSAVACWLSSPQPVSCGHRDRERPRTSQTDSSYSHRLPQCVCVHVSVCGCSCCKTNSDLSTDAPCGGVRFCAVPHALEPAAETGPAAAESSH